MWRLANSKRLPADIRSMSSEKAHLKTTTLIRQGIPLDAYAKAQHKIRLHLPEGFEAVGTFFTSLPHWRVAKSAAQYR